MHILVGYLSRMSWELGATLGLAALSVIFFAAGLWSFVGGPNEVVERLERAVGTVDLHNVRAAASDARRFFGRLVQPLAWLARPTKAAELSRLRTRLVQGGYRGDFAMEMYLSFKILIATALTLGFLQINAYAGRQFQFPMDLVVAVWTCGFAFFLPNIWLGLRVRDRQQELERGLPDAMDLLVTCVESGLGLDAALARVAEELTLAAPALGRELNLTFLEIQAGVQRREAFRRLADRTGVEDLKTLAAVLTQTEIFGTSIARALRVHADGMRVKRMQKAEERAAMVSVKMTFPLVLCILPSLVAVVLGPAAASIAENFFPQWAGP